MTNIGLSNLKIIMQKILKTKTIDLRCISIIQIPLQNKKTEILIELILFDNFIKFEHNSSIIQ
jgi:hypothetical protein